MQLYFEKSRRMYNTVKVSRNRTGHSFPYPFVKVFYYGNLIDLLRHKTIGNTTTSYFEHFKNWNELLAKHPCLAEAKNVAERI